MTQHIKTHFKERGINSLSANGINNLTASSNEGEDYQQQVNKSSEVCGALMNDFIQMGEVKNWHDLNQKTNLFLQ